METTRQIKRGDIYFAEIPKTCGSVYYGLRPVLVISNSMNNLYSKTITCIPITSKQKAKHLPTHVHISGGGLRCESIAMCENVSNYSVEILRNCIGNVAENSDIMGQIEKGIMIQVGITL